MDILAYANSFVDNKRELFLKPKRYVVNITNLKDVPANGKYNSCYEWLGTDRLSHSEKIKSGTMIQQFLIELAKISAKNTESVCSDRTILCKDNTSRQMDLLHCTNANAYYREIKTNSHLDSEKSPANKLKINLIAEALFNQFPTKSIDAGFLCPSQLEAKNNIDGINDFLHHFGLARISMQEFGKIGALLGSFYQ